MSMAPDAVRLPRWKRIVQKAALRVQLGWHCLSGFDDDIGRSTVRVSFAQNGEDIIAWRILNSLGIRRPRYLDIGAHDPVRLSNTALFHLFGCRGVNVEPDPDLFRRFLRRRPHDLNLNVGIGPIAGEMAFFRMADPLLNTFSLDEAERMQREEGVSIVSQEPVRVERIDTILAQAGFTPDFLSIDAEGHDLAILQSWDFNVWRPAVICVETLTFSTRATGQKLPAMQRFLGEVGYRSKADTHINTLFVDERRRSVS